MGCCHDTRTLLVQSAFRVSVEACPREEADAWARAGGRRRRHRTREGTTDKSGSIGKKFSKPRSLAIIYSKYNIQ